MGKKNFPLVFAEFIATMILLMAIVGSGVMAARLAGGNVAIALLANTLATVFALFFLIEIFGKVSGAHMNPAVSLLMFIQRRLTLPLLLGYIIAQIAGAILGVWITHAMFDLPIIQFSATARSTHGLWLAEFVATIGLLLMVIRAKPERVSFVVAAYIGSAYWFTSSTSFANPAVTIGRLFSDTFAGIMPSSVPVFILCQLVAVSVAIAIHRVLGQAEVKND